MTLSEFLDFNIRYVEMAVDTVEPGGDLQPMLIFLDKTNQIGFVLLKMQDKDAEMAAVRHLLRERGATQYALICPAWSVVIEAATDEAERLRKLVSAHGTSHPELLPYRREIYAVSVGDKDATLVADLAVTRDAQGRIIKLTRRDSPPHTLLTGRMMDLLAEARH